MALSFHLHDDTDEALFHPGRNWLPTETSIDRKCAALHFAPFHRQILIRAAGITADDFEAQTESIFEYAWDIITAAADTGGRTTRRLAGITDIFQSFIWRVG